MRLPVFLLCAAGVLTAAEPAFWPGASYDERVPTIKKVLGHEPGERITPHAGIVRYFEALAAAMPGRVKIFEYGRTWQGRRLIYAAVGSEANVGKLDAIKAAMKKLADPRKTSDAEAKQAMTGLPALVWLGYGVHGNEISSPDAAMMTAYHLLAARNDKLVQNVLANTVVLIDPAQNPDGRDRFVNAFETSVGLEPDASPLAAEHVEPWPAGRTNHYHFDMNRDWFALTQPETRGRVKALQEWYPLVFVDLHEMGSESTYYFAPEAVPYNPHLAKGQTEALDWFGKNNAKWFDQNGFAYFTREVYDAFYPGYGASWPAYYGAVAMTYEQASARGLLMRRSDDSVFSFRDTVRQHFVASVSTCETAATNRDKLLANFWEYRKSAIDEGKKGPEREYVLVRKGDTSSVDKLAQILADQGIEVRRATSGFKAAGQDVPAGSYLIDLAQPSKRMIRTLLDADVSMGEKFVKEAERRRKARLSTEIYDVVAWSLPALYNVELLVSKEPVQTASTPVAAGASVKGTFAGAPDAVAYVAPWGTTAAGRLLTAALRKDLKVFSSDKEFVQNGRRFPRGTLIFPVKRNEPGLEKTLAALAESSGAEVVATNSGWVEEGVNWGSRNVVPVRAPRIAIAWDRPTGANAAGATRFVLERQYGYPTTVIRTSSLATADLSRFDVLILPPSMGDGGYGSVLGSAVPRLKNWVSAGGVLIGFGSAMAWLAEPRVGLLAVQQENVYNPDASATSRTSSTASSSAAPTSSSATAPAPTESRVAGKLITSEADYLKAIRPTSELPDDVPGVMMRARTDPDHWITAGAAPVVTTLVQGRSIFAPIRLDKGVNAAVFPGTDELLAGGYLWEENRKQYAWKPMLVVQREGRGNIVGFAADPNFRAYQDGMNVLFLNAVFRGAAHSRPSASAAEEE